MRVPDNHDQHLILCVLCIPHLWKTALSVCMLLRMYALQQILRDLCSRFSKRLLYVQEVLLMMSFFGGLLVGI